jgi:hypothetical protein
MLTAPAADANDVVVVEVEKLEAALHVAAKWLFFPPPLLLLLLLVPGGSLRAIGGVNPLTVMMFGS